MKNTCEPVDFLGKDWYRPATLVELFHRKFPNNLWNLSTITAKSPPYVPKICHTYPTIMKLGTAIPFPKKIQDLYELRDTLLEFR